MEVLLIRHTAVEVAPGICYGQTDVPLKSTFEQEAEIVKGALLSHEPFDAVYTSPLSRCARLAVYCGYPDAILENRIMEINFGEWEMQPYAEIQDPRLQEWYDDYLNVRATGGESFMILYERVVSFLEELKTEQYSKVALFCHGGSILCAQVYAKTISVEEAFKSLTPYGGIVRINI